MHPKVIILPIVSIMAPTSSKNRRCVSISETVKAIVVYQVNRACMTNREHTESVIESCVACRENTTENATLGLVPLPKPRFRSSDKYMIFSVVSFSVVERKECLQDVQEHQRWISCCIRS